MLLEQTAAEEDLSAPGLSMTAGSKSVLISVNQCHRWFYKSYKGLGIFQLECSPKTDPEVMRGSGAERRRNSHEKEKTYTGRNHQKAA